MHFSWQSYVKLCSSSHDVKFICCLSFNLGQEGGNPLKCCNFVVELEFFNDSYPLLVDQLINFTSLNMSDEDYIWRSESFLESDEDEDVTPDSPVMMTSRPIEGRSYFDDDEEEDDEDLDEDEMFNNPHTPGLVPRSPVEAVPRPYGAWAAQRRGHRRRSPIMARSALRSPPRGNREPREGARAPPSGPGPFSRGGGERGRRNSRARGQWGRPSDLRFLR